MYVYIVHHTHEVGDDVQDVKVIGIYSKKEIAQAAIDRSAELPGFRESVGGFSIDEYLIDQDNWTEGFVSSTKS